MHIITGNMVHEKIGPGFWGIIDDQGRKWRPLVCPLSMQKTGKRFHVKLREVEEDMSIFMWGTPVEVLEFAPA
jgi:hypothetical protein